MAPLPARPAWGALVHGGRASGARRVLRLAKEHLHQTVPLQTYAAVLAGGRTLGSARPGCPGPDAGLRRAAPLLHGVVAAARGHTCARARSQGNKSSTCALPTAQVLSHPCLIGTFDLNTMSKADAAFSVRARPARGCAGRAPRPLPPGARRGAEHAGACRGAGALQVGGDAERLRARARGVL